MQHHKLPNIRTLSTVLLLIFALSLTPAAATSHTGTASVDSSEVAALETTSIYLPFTTRGYPSNPHILKSPFSMSIAALHQITEPKLLEALKGTGATSARVEIKWAEIQPNAPVNGVPTYRWDWYDERLGLIAREGLQLIATIEMASPWAADETCGVIKAEHVPAFKAFITALISRYKEYPYNIKFWELDNEPDRINFVNGQGCWGYYGKEYAQMLAYTYPVIKAADPQATVVQGGIAYDWFLEYNGPFNRAFPDDVFSNGGGPFVDAINFHYFPDWHREWERWDPTSTDRTSGFLPAPTCGAVADGIGAVYEAGGIDIIAKATHYSNRMRVCHGVDKPLIITETTFTNDGGDVDLALQARYVAQVYARALSVGVQSLTWYAMTTPNEQTEQGLLFEDFSPRPGFYAYKTMVAQLLGYQFKRVLSVSGLEGYYFTHPSGTEKLVVWGNNLPLVTSNVSQLNLVSLLGQATTIVDGGVGDLDGAANGSITLNITPEPVYIVNVYR